TEAATRDDVIVTQHGQGTGPIHEDGETRFGANDVERTSKQRGREHALGRLTGWRRRSNLRCRAAGENTHQRKDTQQARHARSGTTTLVFRSTYRHHFNRPLTDPASFG